MAEQPHLRRGSATATAEATAEAGGELAGGTALLAALLAAAVATLTGSTGTALTLLTAHHAAGGSVGTLLLDVGGRDNLSGEVEPLTEVVKTLGYCQASVRLCYDAKMAKHTSGVRV